MRERDTLLTTDEPTDEPLLEMNDLDVTFHTRRGAVEAVNGVDLEVRKGEILCVVGESGSGKSVTVQSIVDLVPQPPGEISGEIIFKDTDLRSLKKRQLRKVRGDEIGVVFQDPMSSLNPVHSVGRQITEGMLAHNDYGKDEARERAVELMDRVGIPEADARFGDFPFEFSGGMRQRVMIAIALANQPDLLIADEPTTALDVTIEAQVLSLIREFCEEYGMSVVWITHDFGVVAEIADRVAVMYAGNIVEKAEVYEIFDNPKHPYTVGLMESIPGARGEYDRLEPVEGEPPDQLDLGAGCRFRERCPEAMDHCGDAMPPAYAVETEVRGDHGVRCYLYEDETGDGSDE